MESFVQSFDFGLGRLNGDFHNQTNPSERIYQLI